MSSIFKEPLLNLISQETPLTCDESCSLAKVIELMKKHKVGAMVVTHEKKPVGIFTERDFLMKVAGTDTNLDAIPINTVMVKNPICVKASEPISRAMAMMRVGNFRNVPVVDEEGHLSHVITVKDVVNFVTDRFEIKSR